MFEDELEFWGMKDDIVRLREKCKVNFPNPSVQSYTPTGSKKSRMEVVTDHGE